MVATYETFEKLSHRVDGLQESFLIRCFIAGLRNDICLDVKIKHLKTMTETIEVARVIEERNQLHRRMLTQFHNPMVISAART